MTCPGGDGSGAKWNAAGAVTYTNTGSSGIVLPLNLISFYGQILENVPQLFWETTGSSSAQFFETERSEDGIHFRKAGSIAALKPESIDNKRYHFKDQSDPEGMIFYRLKLVDIDGRATYTPTIRLLHNSSNKEISIYPNPCQGPLFIDCAGCTLQKLKLTDLAGNIILEENINTINKTLRLQGLIAGIYYLSIDTGAGDVTYKILKE